MKKRTLKDRILTRIKKSKGYVFLRDDFKDLAGYDQVGRALRLLAKEEKVIKVGYGLYAKVRINGISGKPMIAAPGGFDQIAKEALNRLKVEWEDSAATKDYQKGTSTQIPARNQLTISGRFTRKISVGKRSLMLTR